MPRPTRRKTKAPARKKVLRTKRRTSRKATTAVKKPTFTGADLFAKMVAKYPEIGTADQFRLKSWQMFADKLAEAMNKQTTLFCVTVNPDMILHKAELQSDFPCQIVSPTEALAGGGFNFIH